MNKNLQYIFLGVSGLLIIGIGFAVDRTPGLGIRTDEVSSAISLSFPAPLLRGVPITLRWQGQDNQNLAVIIRMVAKNGTVSLGSGKLLSGSMRVTIPCVVSSKEVRIELVEAGTGSTVASSAATLLPPGPDCVR